MPYQVLARKWRPQLFEEVVGQDHVVKTLRNAISMRRIGHAYLFTGQRGTGKTSTARILAKALNCKDGPTPNPCNHCDNCQEIIRGESLDVLEIDGASNRGINEVRDLRERVKFTPAKAKSKVYIIDEVHMLTREAFNALLKTLEEPPSHVIFILATTNPHKLPLTIISRCQRFDFRKISTAEILTRLQQIVEKEGISVTEGALTLIAEGAENSMRDAQGTLEQTISYARGKIREKDVADIMGIPEKQSLFTLTQNVARKDPLANIGLINGLLEKGKDPEWLIKSWQKWFRDLMVVKMGGGDLISLSPGERKEAEDQAACFSSRELLHIMELLGQARGKISFSSQPQIQLEVLVVQLSSDFELEDLASKEPDLAKVYQKILDLEEKLAVPSLLVKKEMKPPSPGKEEKQPETIPPNAGKVRERKKEASEQEEGLPQVQKREKLQPRREEAPGTLQPDEFSQKWGLVVREVEDKRKSLGSIMQKAKILKVENNSATLGLAKAFHQESLKKKENARLIQGVLNKFFPSNFTLHYVLLKEGKEKKSEEIPSRTNLADLVAKAIDLFQGEIVEDTTRR
jgi:DNA polymerase-3 subunit gamma/tau